MSNAPARHLSRGDKSRTAILHAAARAIARDGYHGMSMRDLARATGLGLATSYAHFPSKEDILYALQAEAFDALIASAEHAIAGERDAAAKLHAFILNHLRYFAAHPYLMRVLVQEAGALPSRKRAAIRERKEHYYSIAQPLMEAVAGAGTRGDEVERETYALFGMLNWVYGWYEPRRHGPPEALADTFHRIALRGAPGKGGVS